MLTERKVSVVKEADERLAPVAFAYIAVVCVALGAFLAWVFWFRGYA
jgi:hypothetical protein